jgi:hypothetical protein
MASAVVAVDLRRVEPAVSKGDACLPSAKVRRSDGTANADDRANPGARVRLDRADQQINVGWIACIGAAPFVLVAVVGGFREVPSRGTLFHG